MSITIVELANTVFKFLVENGYERSVLKQNRLAFARVIQLHKEAGEVSFNSNIAEDYIRNVWQRCEAGEISYGYFQSQKCIVRRLEEFHRTGTLRFAVDSKGSDFYLSNYFSDILHAFLADKQKEIKRQANISWCVRKYFAWLMVNGHETLEAIGVDDLQRFLVCCSKTLKSRSLHDLKSNLKQFYRYWDGGSRTSSFENLLSTPTVIERKILPAATQEELLTALDGVDRNTVVGKRDYAALLLGVVTGLRSVDIARLALSDIDWPNGEIRITQAKTGNPLTLPLTADIGAAIKDYILNGRPQSDSNCVFLTCRAPFHGFARGNSIAAIYDLYLSKGNMRRTAWDGKSFHSVRRAVGSNMVKQLVPVTTVAQVLGHYDINSTKSYIPLDTQQMAMCALDFSGIEVEGTHDQI